MRARSTLLATLFAGIGLLLASPDAAAGAAPALKALADETQGRPAYNVVQNRFFVKSQRFEIAPVLGAVPNNAFVKRYVGGLVMAYHLNETFALEAAFMYSPDSQSGADLKGLTHTLVQIAHDGGSGVEFQQPIDKLALVGAFSARWAPVYGKINLIGESVLNFDFYGTAGLGVLSINQYRATYSQELVNQGQYPADQGEKTPHVEPALNVGVGADFFLTGSLALKIDARSLLYVDREADYTEGSQGDEELKDRVYNDFIATVGLSIFFPSMPPRMYNF